MGADEETSEGEISMAMATVREQGYLKEIQAAAEDKVERELNESRFREWGFSIGLGISFDLEGGDRIENAVVDANGIVRVTQENNEVPRLLLETHYFFVSKKRYVIRKPDGSLVTQPDPNNPETRKAVIFEDRDPQARWGHGPFVGIQSSDDEIIDSFAFGWMLGFRRPTPKGPSGESFNVGFGLIVDRDVKILGEGIEPDQLLPEGESEIRFRNESRLGALLAFSFSF